MLPFVQFINALYRIMPYFPVQSPDGSFVKGCHHISESVIAGIGQYVIRSYLPKITK